MAMKPENQKSMVRASRPKWMAGWVAGVEERKRGVRAW